MNGLLGTGASFRADLNLAVRLTMGLALVLGMFLARRKQFRAHKYCQSSVMLLNLVMIFLIMAPSFHKQVDPQLPGGLRDSYYLVPYLHAILGTIAEALGVYIVLVTRFRLRQSTSSPGGWPVGSGGAVWRCLFASRRSSVRRAIT